MSGVHSRSGTIEFRLILDTSNVQTGSGLRKDQGLKIVSLSQKVAAYIVGIKSMLGLGNCPVDCNLIFHEEESEQSVIKLDLDYIHELVWWAYKFEATKHLVLEISCIKGVDYVRLVNITCNDIVVRLKIQAFGLVERALKEFEKFHGQKGRYNFSSGDNSNVRLNPDLRIGALFEAQGLASNATLVIQAVMHKKGLLMVFYMEDGKEARPQTTIFLSDKDVVFDEMQKYFISAGFIMFLSDVKFDDFPLTATALMEDMCISPGSPMVTAAVNNTDPQMQSSRRFARIQTWEQQLSEKKRKIEKVTGEMEILEAKREAQVPVQRNHVNLLEKAFTLAKAELSRMEEYYKSNEKQRTDYLKFHTKAIEDDQKKYDALVAQHSMLEAAAAAGDAGSKTAAEEPAGRECTICLNEMKDRAAFIPCGHEFCRDCGAIVKALGKPCPMCRADVTDILPLHS
jgi:hypothetical protein